MSTYVVWPTGYLTEHRFENDLSAFDGASLLIIGVKSTRERPFYDHVLATGGRVTIIEAFEANAHWAAREYPAASVLCMPIETYQPEPWPTAVVWLQGPEHVEKATALRLLYEFAEQAFVVAEMPHGVHEQGADGGNPYETHRAYLYPTDFPADRWNCAVGPDDLPREQSPTVNQHLLVWSKPR